MKITAEGCRKIAEDVKANAAFIYVEKEILAAAESGLLCAEVRINEKIYTQDEQANEKIVQRIIDKLEVAGFNVCLDSNAGVQRLIISFEK